MTWIAPDVERAEPPYVAGERVADLYPSAEHPEGGELRELVDGSTGL
jgi:hypothetical protein